MGVCYYEFELQAGAKKQQDKVKELCVAAASPLTRQAVDELYARYGKSEQECSGGIGSGDRAYFGVM
jgi:hypothetical protein